MRRLLPILTMAVLMLSGCETGSKVLAVQNNAPLKEQVSKSGMIYEINEAIDLRGSVVSLPSGVTLRFGKSGALKNGTLHGDKTSIIGHPTFNQVRLTGHYATTEFYASWCEDRAVPQFIEDVMNLGGETILVVDKDIVLTDKKRQVDHLYLKGKNTTVSNSDRYYITRGGCDLQNLKFRWTKGPLLEPRDNYNAVVLYTDLLQKDTTVAVTIKNVDADGGSYCSWFMRQGRNNIEAKLRTVNTLQDCRFRHFTMGAVWTCGGTGKIRSSQFTDIGYENPSVLCGVAALRLGNINTIPRGSAIGYIVEDCLFENIVATYNNSNDGRGLHGLLVYGDSTLVRNNIFKRLSTSFSKPTETGMDSEILYFKGSWNVIDNNLFEDGAGTSSDAVVTLKYTESQGNIVRNNHFITTVSSSKFIYVAGKSVTIEGNEFRSTFESTTDNEAYAIYLAHHDANSGSEEATIRNNTFSFPRGSNYMAVYANRRGDLSIDDNTFENPRKLIKNNNREGCMIIKNNNIIVENQNGKATDNFIEIGAGESKPARICDNEFIVKDAILGVLVRGLNYSFSGNTIRLQNASIQTFLRGENTTIEAVNNTISIDNKTVITKGVIVGETASSKIKTKDNTIKGRFLADVL